MHMKYRLERQGNRLIRRVYGGFLLAAGFAIGLVIGGIGIGRITMAAASKDASQSVNDTWGMGTESHTKTSSTKTPTTLSGGVLATQTAAVRAETCNNAPPMHTNLTSAESSQLQKLAEYEQVCGAAIAARSMFFVGMPKTPAEAGSYAADVAATLHDYAAHGIAPLVVLEPNTSSGIANLNDYRNGAYDQTMDAYFAAIKAAGITDAQMGMWAPFPEANLPEWGTTDPATFAVNVTKTVQLQKKYFPGSLATILLDSTTYPSGTSWAGGSHRSLAPYVQGIPRGLLDSFGLQGFPWVPPADEGGPASTNPASYLNANQATEAARALGVHDIWFNTGTFGRAYTNDAKQTVTVDAATRQTMLDGVVAQAKNAKQQGFAIAVHVFAQDKSATLEAIDWAYWPKGQASASDATTVFKTFAHDMQTAGIPLWLFDTDEK